MDNQLRNQLQEIENDFFDDLAYHLKRVVSIKTSKKERDEHQKSMIECYNRYITKRHMSLTSDIMSSNVNKEIAIVLIKLLKDYQGMCFKQDIDSFPLDEYLDLIQDILVEYMVETHIVKV